MSNPKNYEATFVLDGKKAFSDALADTIDASLAELTAKHKPDVGENIQIKVSNVMVAAMENERYAVRISYRIS